MHFGGFGIDSEHLWKGGQFRPECPLLQTPCLGKHDPYTGVSEAGLQGCIGQQSQEVATLGLTLDLQPSGSGTWLKRDIMLSQALQGQSGPQ